MLQKIRLNLSETSDGYSLSPLKAAQIKFWWRLFNNDIYNELRLEIYHAVTVPLGGFQIDSG